MSELASQQSEPQRRVSVTYTDEVCELLVNRRDRAPHIHIGKVLKPRHSCSLSPARFPREKSTPRTVLPLHAPHPRPCADSVDRRDLPNLLGLDLLEVKREDAQVQGCRGALARTCGVQKELS